MQKNLNIIIVIYNIKLDESIAFLKVYENRNYFHITIVDNTTINNIRQYNQSEAEKFDVTYLSKGDNIGLSKAYNLAIEHIKESCNKIEWVITLDQDTVLNQDYFNEILEITGRSSEMLLYYPKVNSKRGVISPILMNKQFIKNIKNKTQQNNIVCINSGLLMNINLFKECIYNENLFLDMIDYDLFCQMIKKGYMNKIKSINSLIDQDFSGAGFSLLEKDYARFKLYAADFKTFCCKWKVSKFYRNYIMFKRCLKLSIHYKSIKFMKELF